MVKNILTFEKMQSIKQCSINNKKFIETLIDEVEFSKVRKLIGNSIYNKILEDLNAETIPEYLTNILENGLYKCIAYLVYSRYVQESMLQDTFTGVVIKDRNDSSTANIGALKNVANEYSSMAMDAYELVKDDICKYYGNSLNEIPSNNFSKIKGLRRHTQKKSFTITRL